MNKRTYLTQLSGLASLGLAILSSSCATPPGVSQHRPREQRKLYGWNDNGGSGKVRIRISLTDQIAEVKRGDQQIGWCYVATGKEGHDTRPGNYTITEKIEDKHSNTYGWFEDEFGNVTNGDAKSSQKVPEGMVYVPAPMPYWMRLTSHGIGMHAGIIPQPGEPASHGCIRMPKPMAPRVFSVVEVGTPVVITNEPAEGGFSGEPRQPAGMDGELPGYHSNDHHWTGGSGGMSAESVTYRNGQPVSYR